MHYYHRSFVDKHLHHAVVLHINCGRADSVNRNGMFLKFRTAPIKRKPGTGAAEVEK